MKAKDKCNKGITLVALVITIIILLILATISIQALTQTGLFQKANEAKEKMQNAEENQAKILNEYEDELNKYISGNVKIPEKIIDVEQGAESHISGVISYSWIELSAIAQKISDNVDISSNTAEVNVTLNGTVKSLGVGDIATVDGKTVRILGFNHDLLTDINAYGSATATGTAGISFEYLDFAMQYSQQMNTIDDNTNGWAAMPLRTALNETVYDSLSIKDYIKAVNKEYIITNNTVTKLICSDKIWLLSCGEIWDNGYNGGNTRGYAEMSEGNQYKYFKSTLGSTPYNTSTSITKKNNDSGSYYWWLRSPYGNHDKGFCIVDKDGYCNINNANISIGVTPGFSI